MHKLNNVILQTHPKAKIYKQAMLRHQVLKAWGGVIEGFFKQAGDLTQAVEFKNGKLFIACLSQVLANKIITMAKSIIHTLNQVVGRVLVYSLAVEC